MESILQFRGIYCCFPEKTVLEVDCTKRHGYFCFLLPS